MNPLAWKREHLLGSLVLSAAGGLVGLLFAWLDSPLHTMCSHSLSGEWADCTRVFLGWLPYYELYWPMVVFGAIIPALSVYALQLLRSARPDESVRLSSRSRMKSERPAASSAVPEASGVHRWQPLLIEGDLIDRIWRGQIALSNAFWGVYVLGCVVAMIGSGVVGVMMRAAGLPNLGAVTASVLFVAYFGFSTVATWNSAWRARRSPVWLDRIWAYSALLIVCVAAARAVLALGEGGLQQLMGTILGLAVLPPLLWLATRYWPAPEKNSRA